MGWESPYSMSDPLDYCRQPWLNKRKSTFFQPLPGLSLALLQAPRWQLLGN